jgi:hypothetical protein
VYLTLPLTLKTFSRRKFWFDSDIFAVDEDEKCLSNCFKRRRDCVAVESMNCFVCLEREKKLLEVIVECDRDVT